MTIISKTNEEINALQKRFSGSMKRFGVNRILRSVNATKEKGVAVCDIFVALLGLVFAHKNLYTAMTAKNKLFSFGKDAVYRFLRNACVNWNLFVFRLAVKVIPEIDALTSENRLSVLIIDDTPFYRDRSKKVELLSRCYDHSEQRYFKGFNMLNLAWSDGQTLIPVDFRMVASGNDKNLLEGSHVKEDNRTLATKRRKDARTSKPALALEMLKSVKGTAAEAGHVLFDSWYTSPSSILSIKHLGFDVVARLKNTEKHHYLFEDKSMPIKKIFDSCKKRRGRSRYLLSVTVEVRHYDFDETVPAKIVFVRDRINRKKWIALISTDRALNEEEIITLYGKRWDIEPFHKMLKSHLRLTTEFQLRSYDAICAHAAIVLTRYIFLAIENRNNIDDRTLGELFHSVCDELQDISFAAAFDLLLALLSQSLCELLHLTKERVAAFVERFIYSLPASLKVFSGAMVCES